MSGDYGIPKAGLAFPPAITGNGLGGTSLLRPDHFLVLYSPWMMHTLGRAARVEDAARDIPLEIREPVR